MENELVTTIVSSVISVLSIIITIVVTTWKLSSSVSAQFTAIRKEMKEDNQKVCEKIDFLRQEVHGASERIVRLETIRELKDDSQQEN